MSFVVCSLNNILFRRCDIDILYLLQNYFECLDYKHFHTFAYSLEFIFLFSQSNFRSSRTNVDRTVDCSRFDSKIYPDRASPSTTDLCLRFSNFPKTLYRRDNSSDTAKLAAEYVSSGDTRIACHHNEAICEIDGTT